MGMQLTTPPAAIWPQDTHWLRKKATVHRKARTASDARCLSAPFPLGPNRCRLGVKLRRTRTVRGTAGLPPTTEMFTDRPTQPVCANKRRSPNLLLIVAVDPSLSLFGSSPNDGSCPCPDRRRY